MSAKPKQSVKKSQSTQSSQATDRIKDALGGLSLPVSIRLGNNKLSEDLVESLSFNNDVDGLVTALRLNPILSVKWGMLCAEASSEVSRLNDGIKTLEAELYEQYLQNLPGSTPGKAPTVDAIKSAIRVDDRMVTLREELRNAEHTLEIIRVTYSAFNQRKDVLIEVSRLARREMDSGMA